jgi:2-hydroxychromene-2-carboxylate isomerase
MPRHLRFYFDYVSHNAYLAWTQLDALATRCDLELDLEPVLFAGMLQAHGQLGPAEIGPKSRWMLRDVLRKAQRFNVPIAPPVAHPFLPLLALRCTCSPLADGHRKALVGALFEAVWVASRDVTDPAVVVDVANRAGLDGAALVEDAATETTKGRLRAGTEAALANEVFGVPSFVVDGMVFWGCDDLPTLAAWVAGDDPLTDADIEPWLSVPSAIRRRRP